MVLPETTPTQRAPFYEDVESLITVGFLTHPVELNGVSVHLRSLSPGDLFLLRTRVGKGSDIKWQAWTIASSIWMVDGYVVLGDPQASAGLYHRILNLPKSALETIFSLVMGLHSRQSKALQATEAYCFESTSRFHWKAYHTGPVNSHAGIPGVERLGLNHVQQMWSVFNEVEDTRRDDEAFWEGMKLVASAQAPKGVQKVDDSDRKRRANEEARRQSIMDRFYYTSVGYMQEGKAPEGGPQFVQRAKTADDLEQEMLNWVSGKEDWHDTFVRGYKEELIAKYEAQKAEAAARVEALRLARAEETGEPTMLVGYSPDQLAEILRGRGQGDTRGARMVYDDPKRDSVYQKYVVKTPDPGRLQAVDGRLVVAGEPIGPEPGSENEPQMPDMEY